MKRLQLFLLVIWLVMPAARGAVFYTNLISFAGTNGGQPGGSLLPNADGSFYGATSIGGTNGGFGTVFRLTPEGSLLTLVSFSGTNGLYPGSGPGHLLKASDGNLYGVTASGGIPDGTNSYGTIFRIAPDGTFTSLLLFTGTNPPCRGAGPAGLIEGADGMLYGTTHAGGSSNHFVAFNGYSYGYGTVFQFSTNGAFNTLALFTGTNGAYPGRKSLGDLLQTGDGFLYGTTEAGGTNGDRGTVFKISTNGVLAWSFSFANTNGADPQAGLVQGTDGNLYGVTTSYSSAYLGSPEASTIFKITTNGALTSLVHMSSIPNPVAPLIQASDGNFYGTTVGGGNGIGTVFRMIPPHAFSTLYAFTGGATNGGFPFGGLIQGFDNNFYGTATSGGAYANGVVYRFSIPPPPVFQKPEVAETNGTVTLTWSAVAGRIYHLQYSTNLSDTNWAALGGAITATNGIVSVLDFEPPDRQRFYRVVEFP